MDLVAVKSDCSDLGRLLFGPRPLTFALISHAPEKEQSNCQTSE